MATSSTKKIPELQSVPQHLAIVMDGNGRWATERYLSRSAGHAKGIQVILYMIEICRQRGVRYLTLFAFSSENWRRPAEEVLILTRLFAQTLEREINRISKQGVCLHIIGDLTAFDSYLQAQVIDAQAQTRYNSEMHLSVAINYGGRWDILQATQAMLRANPAVATGQIAIDERLLTPHLSMGWAPEPDLLIRTGGEQRISNFLIWQLAYTELYFTKMYWPDFSESDLDTAFKWYRSRERRFGRTSAQLVSSYAC